MYSLGVIKELGQQELKVKDGILDQFFSYQVVQEADGIWIVLEEQLTL